MTRRSPFIRERRRQKHLSEPLKFAIQTPDAYPTRSPCLDFASCSAGKIRTEELTCRIRKLNFVGLGRMLDSRGHVHGITPQIVTKATAADHTRDCRARMNSNPQFERRAREGFSHHRLPEMKRVAGERIGVAGRGFGHISGR